MGEDEHEKVNKEILRFTSPKEAQFLFFPSHVPFIILLCPISQSHRLIEI